MRRLPYLLFGVAVLVAVGAIEAFGWGMSRRSEVRDVPRTVRENPASYRPHYVYTGSTYRRGK